MSVTQREIKTRAKYISIADKLWDFYNENDNIFPEDAQEIVGNTNYRDTLKCIKAAGYNLPPIMNATQAKLFKRNKMILDYHKSCGRASITMDEIQELLGGMSKHSISKMLNRMEDVGYRVPPVKHRRRQSLPFHLMEEDERRILAKRKPQKPGLVLVYGMPAKPKPNGWLQLI